MKPAIEIRELELEDLPRVYVLGEKLFRASEVPALYRTWDDYELVSFFASDYDTCFAAHLEDRLVGFVLGTVLEKRRSAWSYGWIVWIGVEPDVAREGVGTRLVDRVTRQFAELGCRILLADTDPSNTEAVRFFDKNGFGKVRHHIYLEKNLEREKRWARLLDSQRGKATPRPKPRRSGQANRGRRPAANPKNTRVTSKKG